MTDIEPNALAARLERVWQPTSFVVEMSPTPLSPCLSGRTAVCINCGFVGLLGRVCIRLGGVEKLVLAHILFALYYPLDCLVRAELGARQF